MRLFNQTNRRLAWGMSGLQFDCDPFGAVEVPDRLVDACRSRQLPLAVTPMAPEVKASVTVQDEMRTARADELKRARDELALARAGESEARRAAEECNTLKVAKVAECDALGQRVLELEEALRAERADKDAALAELKQTAAKLADAEDRAQRTEAQASQATQDTKKKGATAR